MQVHLGGYSHYLPPVDDLHLKLVRTNAAGTPVISQVLAAATIDWESLQDLREEFTDVDLSAAKLQRAGGREAGDRAHERSDLLQFHRRTDLITVGTWLPAINIRAANSTFTRHGCLGPNRIRCNGICRSWTRRTMWDFACGLAFRNRAGQRWPSWRWPRAGERPGEGCKRRARFGASLRGGIATSGTPLGGRAADEKPDEMPELAAHHPACTVAKFSSLSSASPLHRYAHSIPPLTTLIVEAHHVRGQQRWLRRAQPVVAHERRLRGRWPRSWERSGAQGAARVGAGAIRVAALLPEKMARDSQPRGGLNVVRPLPSARFTDRSS